MACLQKYLERAAAAVGHSSLASAAVVAVVAVQNFVFAAAEPVEEAELAVSAAD